MQKQWRLRWTVVNWIALTALVIVGMLTVLSEAAGSSDHTFYVPFASGSAPNCTMAGQSYGQMAVNGRLLGEDPADNADYNLGYRGYVPTTAALRLVKIGGVVDTRAPQFPAIFSDNRTPAFSNAYQRYRWDWGCNCTDGSTNSPWDTTVLGMATAPGETIRTPDSGYDIGGGYEYMVLYADPARVTLHVGNSDSLDGYVVHLEDVCVDPRLLDLYNNLNNGGRRSLPVLKGAQPFGRALGGEIKVAVRDSGHFLDPRSRNNWWQGR